MQINFMQKAVELAKVNTKGGPFGAVIVKNGQIIASGVSERITRNDPTAHAELLAIREAAQRLNSPNLEGCEIYASGEPCSMCMSAIYWANMKAVYFAEAMEGQTRYIYDELAKEHDDRSIFMRQIKP